jgi:acetyl-CoA carboxylase biotin carboxyl carrier protein
VAERRTAKAGKRVKAKTNSADTSGVPLLRGQELTELRRLIRLVQRTGIGELEVSVGGRTVRIAASLGGGMRGTAIQVGERSAMPAPSTDAAPARETPKAQANTLAITSPMVGTFYRAPAPDADPYVEVGDRVEVGQTVCIVEAMKLMNEIESEVRGRIVQILVENAQPVEFGQTLFLVDPA